MRLDKKIIDYFGSRNKAQEAILQGRVCVNGIVAIKPSFEIDSNDKIEVDTSGVLCGRAGYKLRGFIDELFSIKLLDSIQNYHILDIGSSTGGFAMECLQRGAKHIVCVDVGDNQLHSSLLDSAKITAMQNFDIRDFSSKAYFDLVLCDVSFISLSALIATFKRLNSNKFILLFKPQFEVGIHIKRNKKGVLQDKNAVESRFSEFQKELQTSGFEIKKISKSILSGKEGNEEFFIFASK